MVATSGFTYAGYGLATYGPGGQLLTVLSTNGFARLYRGTQPGAGDGVELAPETGCYSSSPAIASDGQVVWAAWEQWSCAQEGV